MEVGVITPQTVPYPATRDDHGTPLDHLSPASIYSGSWTGELSVVEGSREMEEHYSENNKSS